jgi:hypothetical protein
VSAIIPEDAAERKACAEETENPRSYTRKWAYSILGNAIPAIELNTTYTKGITHNGILWPPRADVCAFLY